MTDFWLELSGASSKNGGLEQSGFHCNITYYMYLYLEGVLSYTLFVQLLLI